jgi:hypothetical protein
MTLAQETEAEGPRKTSCSYVSEGIACTLERELGITTLV